MPLLQINLLAYNEQDFIEESLGCILSQTFKDFLLVVHDNKSTDRTVEICRNVAQKDSRVVLNCGSVNVGPVCQLYKATNALDCKYISIRSANDFVSKTFYSELIEILECDTACSLAYSHGFEFADSITKASPADNSMKFDTRGMDAFTSCLEVMMRYTCPFALWGVYRRSAFEKCRPYQFTYGGDHILIAEMALYGAIRASAERLDYRRSVPIDFASGLIKNAKSQLEENSRQISENSLFYGLKQNLPFTDMAWGHCEMLSLARISDEIKRSLIAAAKKIFPARFGNFMKFEGLGLFELIDRNLEHLNNIASQQNFPLLFWTGKALKEIEKVKFFNPELLIEAEVAENRLRDIRQKILK